MSKIDEYEEKYKWVIEALREEFPNGEVVCHLSEYNHNFSIALMTHLPNGVLWRCWARCVVEGVPVLNHGDAAAQYTKDAFRESYKRACDEQQTSS